MIKVSVLIVLILICFSIKSQELYQVVRGKVIDKDSETPLIGATIQVEKTNPIIAAISDLNGNFLLEKVPVGRHNIIISYVGYENYYISELLVGSAKEIVLEIKLKEKIHKIDEATVIYKRAKDRTVNEMAMVSSRQFTVEETGRYAASLDDPSRMATSFAGVAITGDDIRNEIVIRGNSPRGMLWQIEGVPVPNPNHFADEGSSGGAVSIISNNVLDNSDFLTGAWPAEYSNAISGVFDIKLRNGNNQKREYAFQAGLLGADFAAEGPFTKKSNASYIINYRYSTLSMLDVIGIHVLDEREGIPTFQDLTFKINLPVKKFGTFTFWGLGGNNYLYTESIVDYSPAYGYYLSYDGNNELRYLGATGISHKYFLDNKGFFETSILLSGSTSFFKDDGLLDTLNQIVGSEYNEDIEKEELLFSLKYKRKISSRYTIESGFRIRKLFYDAFIESYDYDSLQFITEFNKNGSMNFFEYFAQSTYNFTDQLSLYTGINYNYLFLNSKYSIEPRLALKWKFTNSQSVTLGYGNHSQAQSPALYLVEIENSENIKEPVNEKLDFNKANHFVISYDNLLINDFRLKIDLYYQSLSNIPIPKDTVGDEDFKEYLKSYSSINDVDWFTFVPLENKGTGENYGIELSVEKFFSKSWYALLTASLYESKYTGKDGIKRNTRFNGNYILNILGGKEFMIKNNILGTNIKYTHIGGRNYTPIKGEYIITDKGGNQIIIAPFDWQKAFSEKLKDYCRLDISTFYRINRLKLAHIFTIEIQNVLDTKNIGGLSYYNTYTHEYVFWYQSGFIPVFKYRIEF